jgi:hypothetical protein
VGHPVASNGRISAVTNKLGKVWIWHICLEGLRETKNIRLVGFHIENKIWNILSDSIWDGATEALSKDYHKKVSGK